MLKPYNPEELFQMKKRRGYKEIYCDGGVYPKENKVIWGFIVVDTDEVIQIQNGWINGSGGFDVERAESEALFQAFEYIKKNPNNYRIYTDSRSVIDKIEGKVSNATKNPHIKGIQKILEKEKYSQFPTSITLEWKRRRSDIFSEKVDDLCQSLSKCNLK